MLVWLGPNRENCSEALYILCDRERAERKYASYQRVQERKEVLRKGTKE